jgi:tRNA(Ile)-lysidine synthase
LADSAQWAQEALVCLSDLAQLDMVALESATGSLDIRAWLDLSAARRSNVLRAWLKLRLGSAASASLVSRLMRELRPAGVAHWPLDSGELRLYRGVLSHRMEHKPQSSSCTRFETTIAVQRIGKFPLPGWGGCLQVERAKGGGVHLAWLGQLELKSRQGAEQFQGSLSRPPRSLKKQYQAAGIPAWEREGPLFYSGGQLIFVPGLGIDARVLALPGQPQVSLRWSPSQVTELKSACNSGS